MALQHSNYNPDLKYGAVADEGDLAITEGSMLIGNSSGLGAELDVSTDTQIIVGDGTTAASVALSGDLTITNAGVVTVSGATGAFSVALAGMTSSVSNSIVPIMISSAPTTTTDTAAVLLTSTFTNLVTTTASVPTLANSTLKGQFKKVQFITDVGDAVLTPATLNGGTTITFAAIGDTAELMWDGSGWQVLALYNVADGTTAPVLA